MNSTMRWFVLANALALGGLAFHATAGSEREGTIGFGVLPVNQPEKMAAKFEPLIAYLEEETGYQFALKTYAASGESGGYTSAVCGLISGETPFAYLAPATIVQARHHDPAIEPVACAVRGGSPTYVGQIVVREDSDLQRPEDLVRRRVIGASPSSTSGNLMPSTVSLFAS